MNAPGRYVYAMFAFCIGLLHNVIVKKKYICIANCINTQVQGQFKFDIWLFIEKSLHTSQECVVGIRGQMLYIMGQLDIGENLHQSWMNRQRNNGVVESFQPMGSLYSLTQKSNTSPR